MQLTLLKAKLHRIHITEACLDYEGSLTLDPDDMEAVGILPYEKILCADVENGKEDRVRLVTDSVTDDHVPFHEAGFRAVDLIGMSAAHPLPYWHTPEDTMDKISEESLLFAGEITVALLNGLMPDEKAAEAPTQEN